MEDEVDPTVDEEECSECGEELLWDSVEYMWFCPNTWEHG